MVMGRPRLPVSDPKVARRREQYRRSSAKRRGIEYVEAVTYLVDAIDAIGDAPERSRPARTRAIGRPISVWDGEGWLDAWLLSGGARTFDRDIARAG